MKSVSFLIFLFCACVNQCRACSCVEGFGPFGYCRYDLIVRGKAIAEYEEREEPLDPRDPFSKYSPYSDFVYSISIQQPIKVPEDLNNTKMVRLRTPLQSSLCGTRLPLDVDAVFFGSVNWKGELTTGICEPNVAWQDLNEEERQFVTVNLTAMCSDPASTLPFGPPMP